MNQDKIIEKDYNDWLNKYQPTISEIDLIEMEKMEKEAKKQGVEENEL